MLNNVNFCPTERLAEANANSAEAVVEANSHAVLANDVICVCY